MPTGTVKFWNDEKGYGFIRPDSNDNADDGDVFVHVRQVEASGVGSIDKGDRVSYVTMILRGGKKPEAASLRLLAGEDARR